MNVSRSKDCRIGFRIAPWDLERLAQLLGGDELVTGIRVEMADGSCYQLENVGEFQSVNHVPGRRIRAVTMESAPPAFLFSEDHPARLALVTIQEGAGDTIRYHVSGPAQAADSLARDLDDWVRSVSPWYGTLAVMDRPRFFLWSVAIVGALALLVLTLYLTLGGAGSLADTWTPGRFASLAAASGLLTVAAMALALNLRRHRLLPVAEFHVGREEEKAAWLDRRRARLLRASVGAAIVAVGGSVLGAFLA